MRSGPRSRSAARFHTLAALLVACGLMAMLRLVAAAQSPQKTVLVLIPLQRGSSTSLDIDDTIRTVLNDGLAGQLDYYTEYLDVARFPEPDYQPAVRDFFRRKYATQTFDVVIAPTNVMVDFVIHIETSCFRAQRSCSLPQRRVSAPNGTSLAQPARGARPQLFRAVWTRGKLRITKSTYTSQSANHTDATARSLTVKRIKLGARNSRTHPSSQK